jgi:hypothetical protein
MSAEFLTVVLGVILSLVFLYIPGAREKLDQLTPEGKQLVMLVLTALIALGSLAIACTGFAVDFGVPLTCDREGIVGLVKAFILAIGANQATYMVYKVATNRP